MIVAVLFYRLILFLVDGYVFLVLGFDIVFKKGNR